MGTIKRIVAARKFKLRHYRLSKGDPAAFFIEKAIGIYQSIIDAAVSRCVMWMNWCLLSRQAETPVSFGGEAAVSALTTFCRSDRLVCARASGGCASVPCPAEHAPAGLFVGAEPRALPATLDLVEGVLFSPRQILHSFVHETIL